MDKYNLNVVIDSYNAIVAMIVLVLSAIFGQFWYLFAAFMLFNILDYFTGCYKARKLNQTNSSDGLNGIIRKLLYWVLVMVAFICGSVLTGLGHDLLHVNLFFMQYIGWFVLASLTINEARSIVENIVQAGVKVPEFLTRGLKVAADLIEAQAENIENGVTEKKSE